MSATIEKPRRANSPSNGDRAERRGEREVAPSARQRARKDERRRQAHRQQAARQRRERFQQRDREQDRILFLLRRGAGVSRILHAIAQPGDSLALSVVRAERLRRTLDAVAAGSEAADGVHIAQRDLIRIVAYLDGRIRCLRDEAAQQKLRAAKRRARQNQQRTRQSRD